jgi:hypothetical protein
VVFVMLPNGIKLGIGPRTACWKFAFCLLSMGVVHSVPTPFSFCPRHVKGEVDAAVPFEAGWGVDRMTWSLRCDWSFFADLQKTFALVCSSLGS